MQDEKAVSWINFWDTPHSIYANEQHLRVHYDAVVESISSHLTSNAHTVLDYGCGDALGAPQLATQCKRLYLYEVAEQKRAALSERFGKVANIAVLDPQGLGALAAGSVDLVIINSVFQYQSQAQATQSLAELREKLAPQGLLIIADIVNPASGVKHDVFALLGFGWRNGFFWAALLSLVKTYFSPYVAVRKQLGLTTYTEDDFIKMALAQGYKVERIHPNFGHNQSRMAFRLTL